MAWHISNRLNKDFENSRCSREQAAESLEANSSAGKQSALSKVTSTHEAFSWPGKTTDALNRSQSGTTCKPSTAIRGEELLTWFLEGFHARTSAPQEEAGESKGQNQACGSTWPASLAKYDPATFSWRTRQCSLDGGLELFSGIWPRWGMMRAGECWALTMPALLTSETGSGYWPTPRTTGMDGGSNSRKSAKARGMWPTPSANDNRDRGNLGTPAIQRRIAKGKQIMLSMSVSKESGALNPDWVEWLMGWVKCWTSIEPIHNNDFDEWKSKFRSQDSAKTLPVETVRVMRKCEEDSATPQEQRPARQQTGECHGNLPKMPHENSLDGGNLGCRFSIKEELRDLPIRVSTREDSQGEAVWKSKMSGGAGKKECFNSVDASKGKEMCILRQDLPLQSGSGDDMRKELCEQTVVEESWWSVDPADIELIPRVVPGIKNRTHRLRCIGNGQVPIVAALAWETLTRG